MARTAAERLRRLGYRNVVAKQGDGYLGWPEKAPFDRIILTAAPPDVPSALLDQLKPGGKLVAPIGTTEQSLEVIEKARKILEEARVNALIIVALIPLALKGVKFRALGAAAVLRRNLLIYGLGGVIAPFIGIKLIDLIIAALGVN